MELWGRDLRHAVLTVLIAAEGPLPVATILRRLEAAGDVVEGGYPRKVVADALGHEVGRGRAVRVRRGWYRVGRIPRTTAWRIRRWRQDAIARDLGTRTPSDTDGPATAW